MTLLIPTVPTCLEGDSKLQTASGSCRVSLRDDDKVYSKIYMYLRLLIHHHHTSYILVNSAIT